MCGTSRFVLDYKKDVGILEFIFFSLVLRLR